MVSSCAYASTFCLLLRAATQTEGYDGLSRVVPVGDRGMITSRIEVDLKPASLDWMSTGPYREKHMAYTSQVKQRDSRSAASLCYCGWSASGADDGLSRPLRPSCKAAAQLRRALERSGGSCAITTRNLTRQSHSATARPTSGQRPRVLFEVALALEPGHEVLRNPSLTKTFPRG